MKKIYVIILSICFIISCSKQENKPLKFVKIPDYLFSINFCALKIDAIINELQKNKVDFKCYDASKIRFNEINCNGKKEEIDQISLIKTKHFIGSFIDKKEIIEVKYGYLPPYEEFRFFIKMKDDYYDTLFKSLKNQFGYENANINILNYDEISWYENPAGKSCIMEITLSKKLRYEEQEKGVCYLSIITRGRSSHVH